MTVSALGERDGDRHNRDKSNVPKDNDAIKGKCEQSCTKLKDIRTAGDFARKVQCVATNGRTQDHQGPDLIGVVVNEIMIDFQPGRLILQVSVK